jgi:hypothetical protein
MPFEAAPATIAAQSITSADDTHPPFLRTAETGDATPDTGPHDGKVEADPYTGVHGWLRLIVVGNLYIAPVLIGLQYMFAWIGFLALAEEHPGVIILGLLLTGVDGMLAYMGIQAAIALRDIHSGAVQQMKHLLQLRLGWAFIGALVSFVGWSFVGLDAEDLIESAARTMIVGIVGFSVAYTYFTVSKRVKATYPDWNAKYAD